MIATAFDFEDTIENAVASVLSAFGLNVFTTGQVYDFYKDRPRVQVQFTLGPGHLRWADPKTIASIGLAGQKIETAWSSTLTTVIVTAADAQGKVDQSAMRSTVRMAYMNLGPQVNGTILTLHKINLVKESGTARGQHPQDSNSETLQMVHDLELSLNNAVFTRCERVTLTNGSYNSILKTASESPSIRTTA